METKKQSVVSDKDLKLVWRILKTNWYIPFIVLPLFYAAGRFDAYKQTDYYQAATQILLKNNDAYYQNNVVTDAGFYSSGSYVDNSNEIRVLSSYDIMKETVLRLKHQLQVSYFIEGRVRTTEQFLGMPFVIKVNNINPGWYEATMDFKIVDYDNYEISYNMGGQKIIKKGRFDTELIDVDFNLEVTRANGFNKNSLASISALNYQFVIHSMEYLIANFQRNMKVENPEYTNILEVKIEDIIVERAVLLLDTLNAVYSENSLKTKYDLNEKTLVYIDKQLEEITENLKIDEDTMQWYKEKKNILDLDYEKQAYFSKLSGYDGQRTSISLQIAALNDLETYIIEDKDPQFLPPNVFLVEENQGFLRSSVTQLYNMQLEMNRIYNSAKESYPGIGDLKQNIKKLKQDLLVYINNTKKAMAKIMENIGVEMRNYIANIKTLPEKQRGVLNIQRKVNVSEGLYNFLLQKRANTRIAKASIVPNVKVIEKPRSMGKVKPDKNKIINGYISAGALVIVFIIFFRAFFFSKITTVDHLKELAKLPVIGVLPLQKDAGNKGVIIDEQPNSKIAESFRNFRTNLQYANVNAQSRTFLVTSYAPGEGKTFTSINLAAILAKTGKKVALLELDLHKPRVSKALEQDPQVGISTYLSNQNSLEEIISPTIIENLYCIYAGPIPPNPSELVLSEKLKELILYCKNNFNFVIIDTPPAGILSDAVYLMQYVEASIFVLNTAHATKRIINFVHNMVEENNLQNVYFLLNGVKAISRKYYYKGYGYTYGYGYGYKGYGNK